LRGHAARNILVAFIFAATTAIAQPSISNVTPPAGSTAGGTTVTINGSSFDNGATVAFGPSNATNVVFVSSNQLTAVTPPSPDGQEGAVTVYVTNTDNSTASLPSGFTYDLPPSISGLNPNNGPAGGGNQVLINGQYFRGAPSAPTVSFGGLSIPAGSVTFINNTQLRVMLPPGGSGTVAVTVTDADGQVATLANAYTFNPGPFISSISPTAGSTAGGTAVTIFGSNFSNAASVAFGANNATSVSFVNSGQLTATTPGSTGGQEGAVTVYVTNPDGQTAALPASYVYHLPPSVSGVSPNNGPVGGGNQVFVNGQNFRGSPTSPSVSFGSLNVPSSSVTFINNTQLRLTMPSGGSGTVAVTVVDPDGQVASLPNAYTFNPAPSVTTVTPPAGSTAGGTPVTITGTNFVNGATVTFGPNSATSVSFISASQLTAVTPASTGGQEGAVTVYVTNPDGQTGSLPASFTYNLPPAITSVTPASGPIAGGNAVFVNGQYFRGSPTLPVVSFGALNIPPASVTFINNTQLKVVMPSGGSGTVGVKVVDPDGQVATLANAYTFNPAPSVSTVTPPAGSTAGGTTVTISGTNFISGATVAFGPNNATSVTFVSASQLTAVTPGSTGGQEGAVTVYVTNPDGQTASLPASYTYDLPPAVTGVTPNAGPIAGGNTVTVNGQYFRGSPAAPTVSFGALTIPAASVTFVNNTQLRVVLPSGGSGTVAVTVVNPDGQIASLPNAYTFNPAPSITGVTPGAGSTAGGTTVTITGTNFISGATVAFGQNNATSVAFVSATKLTAVTPPSTGGVEGAVTVYVTIPDGQTAALPASYVYHLPPAIISLTPSSGPTSGGNTVYVNGQYFRGAPAAPTVSFGTLNIPSSAVTFLSNTVLRVTMPSGGSGTVTVTVTDPDGQVASLTNGYTFTQPLSITSVTPPAGSTAGGTKVTINGANFVSGATVAFGQNNGTSVTFVSSSQLTVITPHSTGSVEGAVTVYVTNPDGQTASLPAGYTYHLPPHVTSLTPDNGPVGGGNEVVIHGQFFRGTPTTPSVNFGTIAIPSAQVIFINNTTLRINKMPAGGSGTVSVTVTDPDGQIATLPNAYTFNPQPSISSITPVMGTTLGGTAVTIVGTNFLSGAKVELDVHEATAVTLVSATQITAVTPASPSKSGLVNVYVTNPDGQIALLPSGFKYVAPLALTTSQLDDCYAGSYYSVRLIAEGGRPNYSWSVTSGQLPSGLSLSTDGFLTGNPTSPNGVGPYTVTIQVSDTASPPVKVTKKFTFNLLFGFDSGAIPPTFFGMLIKDAAKWPTVPVGALGKGVTTAWPFLEPKKNFFDWTPLDQYVADASAHSLDLYWSNFYVPPWAVKDQSTCSVYPGTSISVCKGMVTNVSDWKDFTTALVKRYAGKIKIYELWSEPDNASIFSGTVQDMVLLTNAFRDAVRANDSKAMIASPSARTSTWLDSYFAANGTHDVDVVSIHGLQLGNNDVPEQIVGGKTVPTKLLMFKLGLQNKPIWDTLDSWGGSTAITEPELRAAFVARSLLEHWSAGVHRAYWYGWDTSFGTLFNSSTGMAPAGTAWNEVNKWMRGATMPHPCSQNGGTYFDAMYTCVLLRSGGYEALAVWDTSLSCTGSSCPTTPYVPNAMYTQYRDINGNLKKISPGATVPIGAKPILLENHNP
jgi:IPT/TIG domain